METAESRLSKTLFVVEATSFEQHVIWEKNQEGRFSSFLKWEQVMDGWGVHVGDLEGRPCMISVSWARIEGHLVMFWYPMSQVSDSAKSEAWISKYFSQTWDNGRRSWCDAQNFHLCMQAIKERKELDGAK